YYHSRGRNGQNVVPPIRSIHKGAPTYWGTGAPDADSYRMTDYRLWTGENAPNSRVGEAFIAQTHVEYLNSVRNRTGIKTLQRGQLFWTRRGGHKLICPR